MKLRFIADNDIKRMKGLMFQDPLEKNECALFIFPYNGQHSFWNKNVSFPISLIFCDDKKNVVDVKKLNAEQATGVTSKSNEIKYVIEAHIDLYNKIKKGNKFRTKDMEVIIDGLDTKSN